MGEYLVSITADDVVVVFGLRRRVAQLPAILQATAETGARLLYVTDEAARARAGTAWHFRCHTRTPGELFDHVSVTALCYVLVSRLIALAGAAGRRRLREIEAYHDRLSEL
jgi:DNA-binding MurR/RpiR family transcriptional regulator